MFSQVHSNLSWAVPTKKNIFEQSAENFLFSLLVISGHKVCKTKNLIYWDNVF